MDTVLTDRRQAVDLARAEAAVTELLAALGQDVASERLADTPRRVAANLRELLSPQPVELTSFANDEGYRGLVIVRDIPFHSLCEHHLLPFRGVAHVGYLPDRRLIGLSALARVVEQFSRGLQLQERLTQQIADHLDEQLDSAGVGVVIEAEQLCMTIRGSRAVGSTTTTSVFTGLLAADSAAQLQFCSATDRPHQTTTTIEGRP